MAVATHVPISIMATAGEGGAWGIALPASYMVNRSGNESLDDFLKAEVFVGKTGTFISPDPVDASGFNKFMKQYTKGLAIESAAVKNLYGY